MKAIYNNNELLKLTEKETSTFITQDSNYSDQGNGFFRFDIQEKANSPVIGRVTLMNGIFEAGKVKNFDGNYLESDILNRVADSLNKNS